MEPNLPENFKDIEKFLREAKPDTHFSPVFAARLRDELVVKKSSWLSPYVSLFGTGSFQASLAGALVAIIFITPLTYLATRELYVGSDAETYVKNITSGLSLKQQVNSKGMNAFGKISYIQPSGESTPAMSAAPTLNAQAAPDPAARSFGKGGAATSMVVDYSYTGDDLKLDTEEGKVFMRVKNTEAGKQLAEFIKKSNFGLVDMPSFSSVGLQNIQLFEDKPFGYSINVNFDEGNIYIAPDYRKWDVSQERAPLSASQLPADTDIITIAADFIKQHGIDVSTYGKPIIENKTNEGNVINVTYPLILEDMDVYDESGNAYGLHVGVDLLLKRVVSVSDLTSQVYESSNYPLETNAKKVISAATGDSKSGTTTETLELKTPKRVLMRHFIYSNKGVATELYVPALLFPIEQKKGIVQYQKNVVVPLIKDALAKMIQDTEVHVLGTTTSAVNNTDL
ncbi:hypothetical protein KW782_00155 [Candidatus Parcubacteria bacterium]|nr:hypothetical protein [Candidatus Parcubacteria bacterium]